MNLDINLSNKTVEKQEMPKMLFLAILFAILSFAIFIGCLVYLHLLNSKALEYREKTGDLEAQISRALSKQDNYAVFVNKVSAIGRLLASRVPQDTRLSLLFSKIPKSIEVSQIDMGEDSIRLQLSSRNLDALNGFLDQGLTEISESPGVLRVDVVSFERTAESDIYTASVLVTYDEK